MTRLLFYPPPNTTVIVDTDTGAVGYVHSVRGRADLARGQMRWPETGWVCGPDDRAIVITELTAQLRRANASEEASGTAQASGTETDTGQ